EDDETYCDQRLQREERFSFVAVIVGLVGEDLLLEAGLVGGRLQLAVDGVGTLLVLDGGAVADDVPQLREAIAVLAVQGVQRGVNRRTLPRRGHDVAAFEKLALHEHAIVEPELRRRSDLLPETLDR